MIWWYKPKGNTALVLNTVLVLKLPLLLLWHSVNACIIAFQDMKDMHIILKLVAYFDNNQMGTGTNHNNYSTNTMLILNNSLIAI